MMEEELNVINVDTCHSVLQSVLGPDISDIKFNIKPLPHTGSLHSLWKLLNTQCKHAIDVKSTSFLIKCYKKNSKLASAVQERESFFHQNFLRCIEDRLRASYDCMIQKFYGRFGHVSVFENLTEDSYRAPPALNKEETELCLKTLAAFHAATFGLEEAVSEEFGETTNVPNIFPNFIINSTSPSEDFIKNSSSILTKLYDLSEGELKQTGLNFGGKLEACLEDSLKLLDSKSKLKKVCCHGEFLTGDVWFKYDQNGRALACKFSNFESSRYAPPAYDATLLIHNITQGKYGQIFSEYFLDFYYECLQEELYNFDLDVEDILTRDEFSATCRALTPFAKISRAVNLLKQTSDVSLENLSGVICALFQSNANFKRSVLDCLKDLSVMFANELVTQEDCHAILRKCSESCQNELLESSLSPFPEKLGLLGEHFQLTISATINGKPDTYRFFVKTLPEIDTQKQFAMETGAFFKEHQMFNRIIPHMEQVGVHFYKEIIPKCYLTRLHDVAVFEDVEVQGFTTLSQRESLSFECVVLVVDAMVKLHAGAFILEEILSLTLGREYRMLEEYEKEFQESFYSLLETSVNLRKSNKRTIVTEIDMFPDPNSKLDDDSFKKLAVNYIDKYNDWMKPSKKYRNTICHGDLWASNVMFKFKACQPIECKIVDFQCYRYLPPAHDLLCFLYLSTDRAFRRDHMETILQLYFEKLEGVLRPFEIDVNQIMTYEEFLQSCRESKTFAASQSCTHFTSIMLTKEQRTELFADPAYNTKIFFEDRSDLVVRTCDKDPVYRERLKETIADFRECLSGIL